MGLELARAFVTIGATTDQLNRDLEVAKTAVKSAISSMAVQVAGLSGALGGLGSMILASGMAQAGQTEANTIKLETMLGSAQEAKKTIADLTKFAVDTPFEMPGIMSVAIQMATFGERGDEMIRTMEMMADVSQGNALDFQILGMVFNQVRGVGKLLTQDFRQLATRGMISMTDLAEHMGVSTAEATKAMSSGEISFDMFREVLMKMTQEGGRFENMAIKMSTSLIGLKSTLSDAVNILYRTIATPMVPYVKAVYAGLIEVTNALMDVVNKGGDMVGFMFAGATAANIMGAAVAGLVATMMVFGVSLSAVFGTFAMLTGAAGIVAGITAIGAGFGYIAGELLKTEAVIEPFKNAWLNTIEQISEAWTSLTTQFGTQFNESVGGIMAKTTEWATFFATFLETISADWGLTWQFIGASVNVYLNQIRDYLWGDFGDNVKSLLDWLAQAFFGTLETIWDLFKDSFLAIFGLVSSYTMAIGQGIRAWLTGDDFSTAFMDRLGDELNATFEGLSERVKTSVSVATAVFDQFAGEGNTDTAIAKRDAIWEQMEARQKARRKGRTEERIAEEKRIAEEAAKAEQAEKDKAKFKRPPSVQMAFREVPDQYYMAAGPSEEKDLYGATNRWKGGDPAPARETGFGRIGFSALANKIQDDLLAPKDKDEERNTLLSRLVEQGDIQIEKLQDDRPARFGWK